MEYNLDSRVQITAAPCDAAPRQVVRGHLHRDLVSGQDTDGIHTQLAGNVGQYLMAVRGAPP